MGVLIPRALRFFYGTEACAK
ncbi:uncharacterized protein G2W53_002559 [Senna tora]|uniref:Uncharacterized protein n=1 Tax=Senna tora TaxID=362788 RepID=A0A834X8C3_9FABA|nr:uncharacterized protein G2W53_002559 [Senna tora]